MNELDIINLYDSSNNEKNDHFNNNISSNLRVVSNYDEETSNYEWLTIMEDTIRYLDNILRNPNRFIVNEEEIVKIELARRITVESIKHFAHPFKNITAIFPLTVFCIPQDIQLYVKELLKLQAILCLTQ